MAKGKEGDVVLTEFQTSRQRKPASVKCRPNVHVRVLLYNVGMASTPLIVPMNSNEFIG